MTTMNKTRKTKAKKPPIRMLTKARVAGAIETMMAPSGGERFGAGKAVYVTAEKDPARVYPYFDQIASLLDSKSKIMRWESLRTLGALAAVDGDKKLSAYLPKYLAFIRGDNMISAANAVKGASLIAQARPDVLDRVLKSYLAVERAEYETDECRNVVIGQVLDSLERLGPQVCNRPKVKAFIKRQQKNTRASVAKCAKRLTAELN
ncbi:MAG TPA: hypothetical protein PKN33_06815 [Phycisphaerae bacterium]|nr:hypothetical protein [Phycisphaerae bacterium]